MPRSILISLVIATFLVMIFFLRPVTIPTENQEIIESEEMSESNEQIIESEDMYESKEMVEPKYKPDEFQAGINLLVYGHPKMSDAPNLFNHLRQLGVNSVAIVFPLFQEDWQADMVKISSKKTPTMTEINGLIVAAQAEGLSVMLRPILDEKSIMKSGHWRGTIQPKNPEAWFESYRSLMLTYAELAQTTSVEVFNIGTELNSLQNNHSAEWIQLIKDVREVYQGKLIYSFNWDRVSDIPAIEFVSLLDYVGIDAYFPLDVPDDASVGTLEEAWKKWMREVEEISNDKSIVITEAGIIPVSGAYRTPYVWSIPDGTLDQQAQANYYEATYNMWRPMIEGIYWWSVTLSEPNPNVIDFSPLGSPTESVIKQFFLD